MSWISVVKLDIKDGIARPNMILNNRDWFLRSLGSNLNVKDVGLEEFKINNQKYAFVYKKADQKNASKPAAAVSKNGKIELRGNVIIAGIDKKTGRAVSLSPDDIDKILKSKVRFISNKPMACFDAIQLDYVDTRLNNFYRKYVGM
jgi:hypothetical protein